MPLSTLSGRLGIEFALQHTALIVRSFFVCPFACKNLLLKLARHKIYVDFEGDSLVAIALHERYENYTIDR